MQMGRDSNPALPSLPSVVFDSGYEKMFHSNDLLLEERGKNYNLFPVSQWLVLQVEHNRVGLVFLPLENKRIYTLVLLTINITPWSGQCGKILYHGAILHTSCTDTTHMLNNSAL